MSPGSALARAFDLALVLIVVAIGALVVIADRRGRDDRGESPGAPGPRSGPAPRAPALEPEVLAVIARKPVHAQ